LSTSIIWQSNVINVCEIVILDRDAICPQSNCYTRCVYEITQKKHEQGEERSSCNVSAPLHCYVTIWRRRGNCITASNGGGGCGGGYGVRSAIICTVRHDIVARHVRCEICRRSLRGSALFQRPPTKYQRSSVVADRLGAGPAGQPHGNTTPTCRRRRRAMINCDVVLYEHRSAYFTARLPRPRRPGGRPGALS